MGHTPEVLGSALHASSKKIKHQTLYLSSHSAPRKLSMNFVTEFQGGKFTTRLSESTLYALCFQVSWEPVELLESIREGSKLL